MEKYKQLITDVLVVCVLPIALLLAYRFYFSVPAVDEGFLSADSTSLGMATPSGEELGTKTKEILNTLDSINFDTTFFSEPAFLSLNDFTPVYVSTSTGRPYPFTTPEDVQVLLDKANQSTQTSTTSTKSTAPQKTTTKKISTK